MNDRLILPTNCDLCFIDIESNDCNEFDKEMIQFGVIRVNSDGSCKELNLTFKIKCSLSNYIINLLKLDDVILSDKPNLDEKKQEIVDFLDNSLLVTFGEWDYPFLQRQLGNEINLIKYNNQTHLNLQNEIKKITGKQLPLLQLHKFLCSVESLDKLQHNAWYDALLLKDIYFQINGKTWDEIIDIGKYVHVMPRKTYPHHKIFSKLEYKNKLCNFPISSYAPFVVKTLKIWKFMHKQKKETIHYIKELNGFFLGTKKEISIKCEYNIEGQHMYEIYKDECYEKIMNFICSIKNSGIIFLSTNKDNIQHLAEIIYDVTKIYFEINFVNLQSLQSQEKENKLSKIKIFENMIKDLPIEHQWKFKGYYNEKNNNW